MSKNSCTVVSVRVLTNLKTINYLNKNAKTIDKNNNTGMPTISKPFHHNCLNLFIN